MSIVFDRAVEYYDETRALEPEVEHAVVESLIRETGIGSEPRVLELGIGTGRVGLPLARRIGRVSGVDLSLKMMQVLQDKRTGNGPPIDLAQADVLRLPFADASFDLVYAVHVLHLVAGWQKALTEGVRVLSPEGRLAINWHRREPRSVSRVLRDKMKELAQEHGIKAERPGAKSEEEILQEMSRIDADVRMVEVIDWSGHTTPGEVIDDIAGQIHSDSWMIPRLVLDAMIPRLKDYAVQQFGSLDAQIPERYSFSWLIARPRA